MTEEEAKGKWCPMVRAGEHGANLYVAGNWRGSEITEIDERKYTRCVGSACMMFRTYDVSTGYKANEEHGYCGLAGQP